MKTDDELKRINEWFDSEEGARKVKELVSKMNNEEESAKRAEKESKLTYKDGQKVLRSDVFIDERDELNGEYSEYGITNYVHRINENGTLDVCFSSNYAWKSNDHPFNPKTSRLIKRKGKLQNPLYDSVIHIE